MTFRRASRCIAVFAVAFAATHAAIRTNVEWPVHDLRMHRKRAAFHEYQDQFDLVFIGSSRVVAAFDPGAFDRRLADAGLTVKSFNFGIRGMTDFELTHVLEDLMSRRPARLKWVLIEWPSFRPQTSRNREGMTHRDISWHTLRQTMGALESIRRADLGLYGSLAPLVRELRLLAAHYLNYGLGPLVLEEWWSPPGTNTAWMFRTQGRGSAGDRRPGSKWPAEMRSEYLRLLKASEDVGYSERYNLEALRAQAESVEARGYEAIFVTMPLSWTAQEALQMSSAGHVPSLLHLEDPESFPELFELEAVHDRLHLNKVGAERFTRVLAEAFVRHVRER